MSKVLVLGAGQIGMTIAGMLAGAGGYEVTLADSDAEALNRGLPEAVEPAAVMVEDADALGDALARRDVVVSACPFYLSESIAKAAKDNGVHFFDLTEDVATSRRTRELARGDEKGAPAQSPVTELERAFRLALF